MAIVGKILEDHGGTIELHDASEKIEGQRGAWIRMRFAAETAAAPGAKSTSEPAMSVSK
jgi:two-component system nitrogen regulation sensor histidine kinase NtrY